MNWSSHVKSKQCLSLTRIFDMLIRLGVNIADVKNVIIWGNHSSTQYPDVKHATVTKGGVSKNAYEAVADEAFLKGEFVSVSVLSVVNSIHCNKC